MVIETWSGLGQWLVDVLQQSSGLILAETIDEHVIRGCSWRAWDDCVVIRGRLLLFFGMAVRSDW